MHRTHRIAPRLVATRSLVPSWQADCRFLLLFIVVLCVSSATTFASRILTDEAGRRVVLPDHPHRIVCLVPSVTDAVFALGAGADVVAISDYTKYPAAALAKPTIGDPMQPSLEVLLSFHPDIVLGIRTSSPIGALLELERLGIPVYLVNPQGLDGLLRSVSNLGVALDREQAATALVASLQRRINAVRTRTQGLPRPSVFMPIWYDPIMTIGKHAFITDIITAAGGRSITDDLAAEWPQLSLEALIARAPQALLLTRGSKTTFAVLKDKPGWSALPAIQQRRVFYADDRIEFASPVAIDALEDLSRQFHP